MRDVEDGASAGVAWAMLPLLLAALLVAPEPATQPDDGRPAQRSDGGNGLANDQAQGGDHRPWRPAPLIGSLSADRPGFSTGTTSVPVGRLQLELGVAYTRDGDDDAFAAPEALLRYGLADRVELRLSGASYNAFPGNGDADGFTDLTVGLKVEALVPRDDTPAWVPKIALQPSLSLPTGNGDDGGDDVGPGIELAASWPIGERAGLLFNASRFGVNVGGGTRETDALSLLVARQVGQSATVFAEVLATFEEDGEDGTIADAGASYLLSDNAQIDAFAGIGLDDDVEDIFVGAGLSLRL